jgi:hypothetical protein
MKFHGKMPYLLKPAQPRALISLREVANAKALSSNDKSNPKPQCQMFWILSFDIYPVR